MFILKVMNMRIAILMSFLLTAIASYGQLHLFGVIAGPTTSTMDFKISQSMGEPFVQQQTITPYLVTEGFQQGDVQSIVAGTGPVYTWDISFSPNPVADVLQVKWTDANLKEMELVVIRADGIIISRQRITEAQSSIRMGHVNPGTYIVRGFDQAGKQIIQQKVIKI